MLLGINSQQKTLNRIISAEILPSGNQILLTLAGDTVVNDGDLSSDGLFLQIKNTSNTFDAQYFAVPLTQTPVEPFRAYARPPISQPQPNQILVTTLFHIPSTATGITEVKLRYNNWRTFVSQPAPLVGPIKGTGGFIPVVNNSTFSTWTPLLMRGVQGWGVPLQYEYALGIGDPMYIWENAGCHTTYTYTDSTTTRPTKQNGFVRFTWDSPDIRSRLFTQISSTIPETPSGPSISAFDNLPTSFYFGIIMSKDTPQYSELRVEQFDQTGTVHSGFYVGKSTPPGSYLSDAVATITGSNIFNTNYWSVPLDVDGSFIMEGTNTTARVVIGGTEYTDSRSSIFRPTYPIDTRIYTRGDVVAWIKSGRAQSSVIDAQWKAYVASVLSTGESVI